MAIIVFSGLLVGILFDLYRVIHWRSRLNKFLTFVGDILFSLAALFLLYFFGQKANSLELRVYLFGGSLFGLFIYLRVLSKPSQRVFNLFIDMVLDIVNLISGIIKGFFKSLAFLLELLMRVPYGILQWAALLLYRMLEALGKVIVIGFKEKTSRITKP